MKIFYIVALVFWVVITYLIITADYQLGKVGSLIGCAYIIGVNLILLFYEK